MKEIVHGTKEFLDKIDITDPCYNRDVWCRINNFPITAGVYECYTHEKNTNWGKRVARIGIRRGTAEYYEHKGTIGVDAGLAGFFNNKPDYNDEQWDEFVYREGNAWIVEDGFYSSSGYGDGVYSVYAGYKDGEIVDVCIDFFE